MQDIVAILIALSAVAFLARRGWQRLSQRKGATKLFDLRLRSVAVAMQLILTQRREGAKGAANQLLISSCLCAFV
jgi:hypothetical protein